MTPDRIKELRKIAADSMGAWPITDETLLECLDEIERLRAVLEEIAHGHADTCKHKSWSKGQCECDYDENIARRALKGDGK